MIESPCETCGDHIDLSHGLPSATTHRRETPTHSKNSQVVLSCRRQKIPTARKAFIT